MSRARWAGLFYLLNIALGSMELALGRDGPAGIAVHLAAILSYALVVALLYGLFKPAGSGLSLIAALVGWTGCLVSGLGPLGVASPVHPLAIFGLYCVLLGTLIVRSRLLPHAIGVFLMLGGLSWGTFAFPPLVHVLYPYNMAPGILAEGTLTLWLLIRGAKVPTRAG